MATHASSTSFAWLWQDSQFADVQLELIVVSDDGKPCETRELELHAALLGSASAGYFRPRLVSWSNDASSRQCDCASSSKQGFEPPARLQLVREHCAEDLFPAALAVLKAMYTSPDDALPQDWPLLVKMCKQADYWGMVDVLTRCLHSLAHLVAQQQDMGPEQLHALEEHLPRHILLQDSHLLAALAQLLKSRLGSTLDILTQPAKLHWFLRLPYCAVSAVWASMDELTCDSENSVAILLTLWCHHNQLQCSADPAQPSEQHRFLSTTLRLPLLSRSFYTQVLPHLSWFSSPEPDMALLPWEVVQRGHPEYSKHKAEDTQQQEAGQAAQAVGAGEQQGAQGAAGNAGNDLTGQAEVSQGAGDAACGGGGAGQGSSHMVDYLGRQVVCPVVRLRKTVQSLTMQWSVSRDELRAAWAGPRHATPAGTCYWAGFTWLAFLEFKPLAEGQGKSLGMFLWAQHCQQLCDVVPDLVTPPAVAITVSMSVAELRVMRERLELSGLPVGWSDVAGVAVVDLDRDLLVPHLVEGRLHCRVVLEQPE